MRLVSGFVYREYCHRCIVVNLVGVLIADIRPRGRCRKEISAFRSPLGAPRYRLLSKLAAYWILRGYSALFQDPVIGGRRTTRGVEAVWEGIGRSDNLMCSFTHSLSLSPVGRGQLAASIGICSPTDVTVKKGGRVKRILKPGLCRDLGRPTPAPAPLCHFKVI